MKAPLTIDQVLAALGPKRTSLGPPKPPPFLQNDHGDGVMLAVETMREHTSDEGWQLALALHSNGYALAGHGLPIHATHAAEILRLLAHRGKTIGTVVVQDKREWDVQPGNFRDPKARFMGMERLRNDPELFKVTIVKDAQHDPEYHKSSADDMGCHGWITYYHPRIVTHLAPYLRPQHCIRTYHSLDSSKVPAWDHRVRSGTLFSGAISGAYPLRQRILKALGTLPTVVYKSHPGYHRRGTETPKFLELLSCFRVAICTASRYGYALRKIMEATACGCKVITDLPVDEVLPEIEENLIRVHPEISMHDLASLLQKTELAYDKEEQQELAWRAKSWYDFREVGRRLVVDLQALRLRYPD